MRIGRGDAHPCINALATSSVSKGDDNLCSPPVHVQHSLSATLCKITSTQAHVASLEKVAYLGMDAAMSSSSVKSTSARLNFWDCSFLMSSKRLAKSSNPCASSISAAPGQSEGDTSLAALGGGQACIPDMLMG